MVELIPLIDNRTLSSRHDIDSGDYWTTTTNMPSSSRVQVMPAHGQQEEEETIYLSNSAASSQVVLMNGDVALSLEEQADMMRANKDKYKCLFLLVETAMAMRTKANDGGGQDGFVSSE